MGSIFRLIFLSPLAVLIVLLAVANRQFVQVSLDPLGGDAWTVNMPLFLPIMGALLFGILVGGVSTWFGQAKHRRAAKDAANQARLAQEEVERLRKLVPEPAAIESNTSTLPASMIR